MFVEIPVYYPGIWTTQDIFSARDVPAAEMEAASGACMFNGLADGCEKVLGRELLAVPT